MKRIAPIIALLFAGYIGLAPVSYPPSTSTGGGGIAGGDVPANETDPDVQGRENNFNPGAGKTNKFSSGVLDTTAITQLATNLVLKTAIAPASNQFPAAFGLVSITSSNGNTRIIESVDAQACVQIDGYTDSLFGGDCAANYGSNSNAPPWTGRAYRQPPNHPLRGIEFGVPPDTFSIANGGSLKGFVLYDSETVWAIEAYAGDNFALEMWLGGTGSLTDFVNGVSFQWILGCEALSNVTFTVRYCTDAERPKSVLEYQPESSRVSVTRQTDYKMELNERFLNVWRGLPYYPQFSLDFASGIVKWNDTETRNLSQPDPGGETQPDLIYSSGILIDTGQGELGIKLSNGGLLPSDGNGPSANWSERWFDTGWVMTNTVTGAVILFSPDGTNITATGNLTVSGMTITSSNTTGAGTALLGTANSPATTVSAVNRWIMFIMPDGGTNWVPSWR